MQEETSIIVLQKTGLARNEDVDFHLSILQPTSRGQQIHIVMWVEGLAYSC